MKKYTPLCFAFTFALLFLTSLAHSQTYNWKQKASLPGLSRWGAFGFSVGNKGYVGGGYHNGGSISDFWEYDPVSNSWTQKSSIPVALRTGSCFVINGLAYLTGGITGSGFGLNANLYAYDPVANAWSMKAPFPGVPRYGTAGFAIGNKGYFGIGNGGSAQGPYYNDFWEYDPTTNSWIQKATFPGTSRYGVHGVSLNGKGYVGFGVNESQNLMFNDWWEYDPLGDIWSIKASCPGIARTYPSSFVLNGEIYLGTGQTSNSTLNDFYSYNQNTNTWIQELNYAAGTRWVVAGFAIGNSGYFGTGGSFGGASSFSEFWEYSIDTLQCVKLKPNSIDGKDAHILSGLPTTNNDPFPEFLITTWTCGGVACTDRQLLQFDMSVIPSNATLIHAGLDLFANPNPVTIPLANYGSNNEFIIQRVTIPWYENTVTWNTQPSTTLQNQIVVPQSVSSSQDYVNLDVTQLVQDMINDPLNSYGFMFRLQNESYYNGRNFATSDNSDSTKWPSITYCFTTSTGIKNDLRARNNVVAYPTVFSDELNLELSNANANYLDVEVYDIEGRIIFRKKISLKIGIKNLVTIDNKDLSQMINGIYLLRLKIADEIVSKKIIKAKS